MNEEYQQNNQNGEVNLFLNAQDEWVADVIQTKLMNDRSDGIYLGRRRKLVNVNLKTERVVNADKILSMFGKYITEGQNKYSS